MALKILEFYHLQDSTLFLETYICINLWCLYMQIKAPQAYTNIKKIISVVMDSSICEVEF